MGSFPLRLPTESTIGKNGLEANARLVNAYCEQMGADKDGKTAFTTYPSPGLTRWSTDAYTGAQRGMILLDDAHLITVLGASVIEWNTSGVATPLAGVSGSDRLIMARNMNASSPAIAICNSTNKYYTLIGGVVTDQGVSEANLTLPNSVCYTGGYFVFGTDVGKIIHTPPIDQATGISALAYAYAASTSDAIIRVFAHVGFLYVFKSKSTEVWGNVGTTPFAFTPVQQYFPLGLLAKHSLADCESGIFWVDHNGVVRNGVDGNAQRISTHTVDRAIASLSAADQQALIGSIISWEGHKCYVLRSTDWTWIYDISMQRWHQRKSGGLDYWLVNDAIAFNGEYICSSSENGVLYTLDPSVYNDDGKEFTVELWCPNANAFPDGLVVDQLDVDCITGVGLGSGLSSDVNPLIMIDYSDDGGLSFRGERTMPLGETGKPNQIVRTNRWGRCSNKGRIWRFRASASVLRGVMQANIDGRKVNT
jgi:hypothetical protein